MQYCYLVIFVLSVIGMTNIIVDPASIMIPFRNFVEKRCHPWINKLFSCYQCTGTWVGFFSGYILISEKPEVVFLCGMSGSFLATFAATYLNYLEAKSIIDVENND